MDAPFCNHSDFMVFEKIVILKNKNYNSAAGEARSAANENCPLLCGRPITVTFTITFTGNCLVWELYFIRLSGNYKPPCKQIYYYLHRFALGFNAVSIAKKQFFKHRLDI